MTKPGKGDKQPEGVADDDAQAEASEEEVVAAQVAAAASEEQPVTLETQLAERTADLQRLQAEYVNYKRRVDRDRASFRALGREDVLQSLLTVLDDIGRAEEHGELTGGFKAVADALQAAVVKHQLEKFGEPGEAFDPNLHEAVHHAGESEDVESTSLAHVMSPGYRVGDRVLRPATVAVVDPASPVPVDEVDESGEAEADREHSE